MPDDTLKRLFPSLVLLEKGKKKVEEEAENFKKIKGSLDKILKEKAVLAKLKAPEYDQMLIHLYSIEENYRPFLNDKKLMGSASGKIIKTIKDETTKALKEVKKKEADDDKRASDRNARGGENLTEANILILCFDYMGAPIDKCEVEVTVASYPKDITLKKQVSRGKIALKGLQIKTENGFVAVNAKGPSTIKMYQPSGTGSWTKLKGKNLSVTATQKQANPIKMKVRSLAELSAELSSELGLEVGLPKLGKLAGKSGVKYNAKGEFEVEAEVTVPVPSGTFDMKVN